MSIHTSSLLFPWARHSAGVKVPTFHWSGQEGTQVPRKHPEEGEYQPQRWPAEVYLNVFSVSQNRKTEAGNQGPAVALWPKPGQALVLLPLCSHVVS